MARRKQFYEKDYRSHIGVTILLIGAFLGLAFATAGTPLGQLMIDAEGKACYTLWGKRPNCWAAEYTWRIEFEHCPDRLVRWEAAEAFSILGVFAPIVVFIVGWMKLSGSSVKTACVILSMLSIGSVTVPWAIVLSFYHTPYCGEWTFTRRYMSLGAGFACLCTSFAVQCLSLLLFIFLEPSVVEVKRFSVDDAVEKDSAQP